MRRETLATSSGDVGTGRLPTEREAPTVLPSEGAG